MRWPRPCVLPATDGPCVALSRDGSAGEGRDGGRRGTAGLAGDGRVPPGPPLRPFWSGLGKTEPAKKRGAFPSASRPANQGEEAGLGQSPGQDQRPGIARCPGGACGWAGGGPQGADPKYYFWGAGGHHHPLPSFPAEPRSQTPKPPLRSAAPCPALFAARGHTLRASPARSAWGPGSRLPGRPSPVRSRPERGAPRAGAGCTGLPHRGSGGWLRESRAFRVWRVVAHTSQDPVNSDGITGVRTRVDERCRDGTPAWLTAP